MPTPIEPRRPQESENSFDFYVAAAVMAAVAISLLLASPPNFMLAILLLP